MLAYVDERDGVTHNLSETKTRMFHISGALTVDRGGLDSLTLHVGMLGVAGIVTLLFPVYAGPVSIKPR